MYFLLLKPVFHFVTLTNKWDHWNWPENRAGVFFFSSIQNDQQMQFENIKKIFRYSLYVIFFTNKPCLIPSITYSHSRSVNIARGTTDPGYCQVAQFALVAKLSARWRHLHYFQIWPPDGATCIGCKFGHKMAPLALVTN